ncbi:hypothetical protein WN51_07392 [Melipona quadrifasciata]|uniref:Uncharacterized protein n=1 Tax=Melipona quadrifasciata TaxID=166423 RepID=A0A0M8ZQU3_9HYME|nr:hypothetical protein WN51_07392 [Melipona quadrifasciata]
MQTFESTQNKLQARSLSTKQRHSYWRSTPRPLTNHVRARHTMKTMGDVVADPADEQNVGTSTSSTQNPTAGKEFGQKTLRSLKRGLGRLWRRHRGNASITEYDPCYKVAYLGNVLTGWAKETNVGENNENTSTIYTWIQDI